MKSHKKKEKVYVYRSYERFWHWTQALLMIILMVTGFEIHGNISFFGFEYAVSIHSTSAIILVVLTVFTIFWHLSTGEWRQYIPTRQNIKAQLHYYVFGIFEDAPHPFRKTKLSKLNPLQKLVYAGLKVFIIPLMILTGLAYMYYRYPHYNKIAQLNIAGLEVIALLHTFGAFLLVAFFLAHLYLMTTGETVTSNLKAMVTGYEELETDESKEDKHVIISEKQETLSEKEAVS
ncbi:MAG: Thiosulfate reductase cytochrome B subunit PhsC [Ignavibacteriaceae bacterium]|nr:Thiosulfate reductase cytochrome B subunit PhsC [Ignavibacteriaceae bacterium]